MWFLVQELTNVGKRWGGRGWGNDLRLTSIRVYEGRSILYRYAQPNRKYFCYKYKETKQQTEKWREPPAIELITPVIVTAKTRNICMLKIQIQRTKKG